MKDLSKLWGCRMNEILITGASGFVGRYLLNEIAQSHEVIACVRKKSNLLPSSVQQIIINNFFDITIPQDVDVVVHLAAVAHNKNNDIDEFKKINLEIVCVNIIIVRFQKRKNIHKDFEICKDFKKLFQIFESIEKVGLVDDEGSKEYLFAEQMLSLNLPTRNY